MKEKTVEAKAPEKVKGYDKYELESCLRTLEEAEAIKADKKKMAALQPLLKKKVKVIKSLADLKALALEMDDDEEETT